MVNGLLLLLPVFSCFAVGRQKGEKRMGVMLAAGAAFVPVLAACWLEAYSAAVLLAGTGAVLPFLDGHCAMAVFYFQMGILETVSCFGNYVKGERGDGDKSRLLDIRDGKIIITYR